MDGGAWWAAVHGVAESRTRLSAFTFTFHYHALEKEMATHSSVLAWRIPGTGEPGGLPSMGSHRVGHDWSDLAAVAVYFYPKSLPFQDSQIVPRGLFSLYFFLTQWWFISSSNFSWLSPFLITHVRIQATERDWFLSHVARGKPRRCSMQAESLWVLCTQPLVMRHHHRMVAL